MHSFQSSRGRRECWQHLPVGCPGSALPKLSPEVSQGLCLLPCVQCGEGTEGTAGGGCHFVGQADYSHVLWASVQKHSPRLTLCLWETLVGCGLSQPRGRALLHGVGALLALLLPRAQLVPIGVREMGGTGSPRQPSVGLSGRSLGSPEPSPRETFAMRGSDTGAVRLLALGEKARVDPASIQGGRRPEPTSGITPVPRGHCGRWTPANPG